MAAKRKQSSTPPTPEETEARVKIDGSDNVVVIGKGSFGANFKIIFQGSRPVIILLAGIALIGTLIAAGYWWSIQPRRMTGSFNIAVAEFLQLGDTKPEVASIVSQQVFRYLDDQSKLITFEDIQVAHKNIGIITSAEEAKALAQRIHAQVVIYGDVTVVRDQARLTPQFYIAEAFRADVGELNGQQKLAAPITFPMESLLAPSSDSLKLLQERTVIMTDFTKTLVYLAVNNLSLAKEAVDQAILHSEQQSPFEGQEVLYLFASEIARLQGDKASAQKFVDIALNLNPDYGRGYIAKANIYYDEENLFQAREYYKKAEQLSNQPFGAYIREKANLGIGNSCWLQLQYVKQNAEPDPIGVADLEKCVMESYQEVINFYTQQENPERNVKEMAAWAYYGIGTIYQGRNEFQDARKMYELTLKITSDDELIQRAKARLQEVAT